MKRDISYHCQICTVVTNNAFQGTLQISQAVVVIGRVKQLDLQKNNV